MSKLSKYNVGDWVGGGRFGNVYLVRKKETDEKLALKVMHKSQLKRSKIEHQVKREIEILSLVEHPHIINLVEWFETDERIYIVTNYAEGGELHKKLKKCRKMTESQVAKYILQLSLALEYLHKLNIIHRDIKSENILLDSDDNILLCDFGWSVQSKSRRTTLCGTIDYLCPEIVKMESYDHRYDLWTIGVLTYELLTGYPPFFADGTYSQIYKNIKNVKVRFPKYMSDEAIDFIKCFLIKEPEGRMEACHVKDHEWIRIHTSQ